MRIVHELISECDVDVVAYSCESERQAFRVEVSITDGDETIFFDGDAGCLLDAFEKAAALIRSRGETLVNNGAIDHGWENETVDDVCQNIPKQDGDVN